MSDQIAEANILGDRGVRYKRNVLGVSLIATVVLWTGVSLSDLSFLGVSLAKSKAENKELVARAVLFVILGYQWVMLIYYGLMDRRVWRDKIVAQWKIPLRFILFSIKKGTKFRLDIHEPIFEQPAITPTETQWSAVYFVEERDGAGNMQMNEREANGTILHTDRAMIKRRVLAFVLLEFGPAFLWGFGCLVVAVFR